MKQLRPEILQRTDDSGRVSFLDPLLQQQHHLSSDQSAEFRSQEWGADLTAFLENAMLLEGLGAVVLRDAYWNSKALMRSHGGSGSNPEPDWAAVEQLPDIVQQQWRRPRPWQRLLELARAGNRIFVLEDLIEPKALALEVEQCHFSAMKTGLLRGGRCQMRHGLLAELMQHPALRVLCSALLHMPLGEEVAVHGWKLEKEDHIGVHADGSNYIGTLAIGCNHEWKAAQGGAIAFGIPKQDHFQVLQRWLPEMGTGLPFRPSGDLFHCVEEVRQGTRHTMTGWWLEEGAQPHHH